MSDWPFGALSPERYGAILADPPWSFKTHVGVATPHRTETDHYRVMSASDLRALPVRGLAARDCVLFMWVVDSHLDQALSLGSSWGFTYKTRAFEWLKTTKDGNGYRIGMGYWTRKQTESCLLFTRGSPRRVDKGVRQIIAEPIREHSRKPEETRTRIERLVCGPYCELFARESRRGWDCWGNELNKFTDLYNEAADSIGSFNDAITEIGIRHKAGETIPATSRYFKGAT